MVGLLTGLVCGLINGLAVAKLKIPPFIVTMSTMTIFAGIALLITKGTPINHFSDAFNFIGGGKLLGIPAPIFVLLLVVLLSWFLMRKTTLGYHIISVGGNENAAKMAGINTVFTKIVAYSFCGLMSGVGGILLTSRVQSGLANLGDGLQMEAIALRSSRNEPFRRQGQRAIYHRRRLHHRRDQQRHGSAAREYVLAGYCQRRRDHAGRVPGYPEEQR